MCVVGELHPRHTSLRRTVTIVTAGVYRHARLMPFGTSRRPRESGVHAKTPASAYQAGRCLGSVGRASLPPRRRKVCSAPSWPRLWTIWTRWPAVATNRSHPLPRASSPHHQKDTNPHVFFFLFMNTIFLW